MIYCMFSIEYYFCHVFFLLLKAVFTLSWRVEEVNNNKKDIFKGTILVQKQSKSNKNIRINITP